MKKIDRKIYDEYDILCSYNKIEKDIIIKICKNKGIKNKNILFECDDTSLLINTIPMSSYLQDKSEFSKKFYKGMYDGFQIDKHETTKNSYIYIIIDTVFDNSKYYICDTLDDLTTTFTNLLNVHFEEN